MAARRHRRAKLWLMGAALVSYATTARTDDGAPPFYQLTGAPPPGFEHLLGPQRALVDVYYGDRRVTSTMAVYTPESVTFEDPGAIVQALPLLEDPAVVRRALSGPLPHRPTPSCEGNRDAACDSAIPGVAAVEFQPERFRAQLLLNPDRLAQQPLVEEKYLPAPDSGVSLLGNYSATMAGSSQGDDLFTLGTLTTLAFDERRFAVEATYANRQNLRVDRLVFQGEEQGIEYLAGVFPSAGRVPSFTASQDIGGIRIGSTLKTRADLAFAYGTPLYVSLASRARIDLIKDGRLVSSRFYDPGNQMLDTAMLPEGAYDVLIRVNEAGRVREEVRYYSKTSRVPPLDQPLFTVELGLLMDRYHAGLMPRTTGDWIARLGYSRRLTEAYGVDIGVAAGGNDRLLELGAFRLDELPFAPSAYYEIQGGVFAGSGRTWGLKLQGQLRAGAVLATGDFRRVNGREGVDVDPRYLTLPGFDSGAPQPVRHEGVAGIHDPLLDPPYGTGIDGAVIPRSVTQGNLSVQFPLLGGVASVSFRENRPDSSSTWRSRSLTYRRTLMRTPLGVAEFRADLSRDDGDLLALVGFRLHLGRDGWTGEIAPRYRYDGLRPDPRGHGYELSASSAWSNRDFAGGELRLAAGATRNERAESLSATIDVNNRLVRSGLSVNHFRNDSLNATAWAGDFSSAVAVTADGWAVGAQNGAEAAVLVNLEGKSPDTEFEVLVDGYRRGYAKGDTTTLVHLPAYGKYEVAIRPRRSSFVDFDDSVRSVTLFPGNVSRLSWQVDQRMVALGRAFDIDGQPIANAMLEGVFGLAMTDANGYFQAEVPVDGDVVRLVLRRGERACRISAPIVATRNGIAFLHSVSCNLTGLQSADTRSGTGAQGLE